MVRPAGTPILDRAEEDLRDALQDLVAPDNKVHLGSRAEWGASGRLVQPWGIIENVPREQLLDGDRDRRRVRAFPKRSR